MAHMMHKIGVVLKIKVCKIWCANQIGATKWNWCYTLPRNVNKRWYSTIL